MQIDADRLTAACLESSEVAAIRIHSPLEPPGGPGAPVKPATYAGGVFQRDFRWWGDPPERTETYSIDNVPSQANHLEDALESLAPDLGLPSVDLDLSEISNLPPHLLRHISGYKFPHRQADAYLRDAILDGRPFSETPEGTRLFSATGDDPSAILQWFPQALLFGYWQSHVGQRRTQSRLARSWVSQVVGFGPAAPADNPTRTLALKGDPMNLLGNQRVKYEPDDLLGKGWEIVPGTKTGQQDTLAAIGHGQVPVSGDDAALGPVSFKGIEQLATLSFPGLRRLRWDDADAAAAGRALVAALGLLAHVAAFDHPFYLRSGCDLRAVDTTWTWIGGDGDESVEPLKLDGAKALLGECVDRARARGLLEGGGWGKKPLHLTPAASLREAIRHSWPDLG